MFRFAHRFVFAAAASMACLFSAALHAEPPAGFSQAQSMLSTQTIGPSPMPESPAKPVPTPALHGLSEEIIARNLPLVRLVTTQGNIIIQLMPYGAPKACENFLGLVDKGYFNNTPWHRIIPGFMIQGGDPTGTGRGGQSIWGKPFADEHSALTFKEPGFVAMANAGPNTNGSQFFITVAPTPWLNQMHTIFGYVVDGYERVVKIAQEGTPSGKPKTPQKIISAEVIFRPSAVDLWETDTLNPQP